jgi:hypothetical protein
MSWQYANYTLGQTEEFLVKLGELILVGRYIYEMLTSKTQHLSRKRDKRRVQGPKVGLFASTPTAKATLPKPTRTPTSITPRERRLIRAVPRRPVGAVPVLHLLITLVRHFLARN